MIQETHHDEYDELLALHALDALEGTDRAAVESHLATCAPCRRRYEEHLGTTAALAGAAPPVEPPAGAREELLRRAADEADDAQSRHDAARHDAAGLGADVGEVVDFERPTPPAPRRNRTLDLLLRAAAVLLLAVAAWSLWSQAELRREVERTAAHNRALTDRLRQIEGDLALARNRLASTSAALATVAAGPETVLAGLQEADAGGRIYSGRDGVLLVVEGLPRPPQDRTYQLWGIVEGTPVSAGLFRTDAGGKGFLWTASVPAGTVDLWAVTEEPAGGVPQPTGEMVLRG